MSAIWGAIDFSGKNIDESVKEKFINHFEKCAIDKFNVIDEDGVYMGCGLQYITEESHNEILPVKSGESYFTADVILDNREEIGSTYAIKTSSDIPDGEILRSAFEKDREGSLKLMLGAYSFVKYNRNNNSVDIVSDAVGNRFVYYVLKENVLYFSSLMNPLKDICNISKLNSRFVSNYLGMDGLDIFTDAEETPYEEMLRIAPATHMIIKNGIITDKLLYWDVEAIKRTGNIKSDEEYRREFVELYRKCVSDTLRADGETALFLSGGYDSTSVACLAAPILKEKNKKLFTYTAVPHKDYVSDYGMNKDTDESGAVKKTAEYLGNLECTFLDLAGVDLWEARKEYNKVCELPYKSAQNMLWIYEGHKEARKKGVRIILSGAFGNGTVSFNNMYPYLLYLLKTLKLRKYMYEVNALHSRFGTPRKHIVKTTIKGVLGINEADKRATKTYERSYAKREFLEKNGTIKSINKSDKSFGRNSKNVKTYQNMFLPHVNFRHYGEFAQKHSIYTGVAFRDPTRDRRMVEFVKSVPHDQFYKNGLRRRLIREYMFDIMPTDFFKNHPVGVQSADTKFRFLLNRESTEKQWKQLAKECSLDEIIDVDKLRGKLNNQPMEEYEYFDFLRLFYTLNMIEFINSNKL